MLEQKPAHFDKGVANEQIGKTLGGGDQREGGEFRGDIDR